MHRGLTVRLLGFLAKGCALTRTLPPNYAPSPSAGVFREAPANGIL